MNRRTFLTRMVGTTVGAVIAPKLFALPADASDETINALYREAEHAWHEQMTQLHDYAWDRLRRHMEEKGLAMRPERVYPASRMGEAVGDGVVLAHQCAISADLEHVQPERAGHLAIDTLAGMILGDGLDHFGTLALPILNLEYAANRGPLRMIVAHNLDTRSGEINYHCRFDVLGGASVAGQRFSAHRRLRRSLRYWGRDRLSVRPLPD